MMLYYVYTVVLLLAHQVIHLALVLVVLWNGCVAYVGAGFVITADVPF